MTMNMPSPERILVFEYISAGAMDEDGTAAELSTAAEPASTGGGESLLRQGIAMRDAIATDLTAAGHDIGVAVGGATREHPPSGCTALDVPAGESPAAFLARLAPAFDRVWVVAPETAGILVQLCHVVGPQRWVGCDAAAIVTCSSKHATREALATHGIAVPGGWQAGAAVPRAGGAWIVKPDDGAGTLHTRRHTHFAAARADLETRLGEGRSATMERWVAGEPLSLSLLCRSGGTELLCINRQRIEVASDGTLGYHGVDVAIEPTGGRRGRRLAALARSIHAAVPGLAGFVGVDLIWTAGGAAVVIEINPRPTCAYAGLSHRLGRNLAADILAGHAPAAAVRPSVPATGITTVAPTA